MVFAGKGFEFTDQYHGCHVLGPYCGEWRPIPQSYYVSQEWGGTGTATGDKNSLQTILVRLRAIEEEKETLKALQEVDANANDILFGELNGRISDLERRLLGLEWKRSEDEMPKRGVDVQVRLANGREIKAFRTHHRVKQEWVESNPLVALSYIPIKGTYWRVK